MQFPNDIQAALLFDRRIDDLESIVRTFLRIEEARSGTRFNVPESKAGLFYRLFGADEMTITFEYVDRAADMTLFQQPLASKVTGLLCPDVRERLVRNRSMILINVSHGILGDSPEAMEALALLGLPMEGQSLPQFKARLERCALAARIAGDHAPPSVVHWTQSNQLIPGETFDAYAAPKTPSPLHVHPYLFGERDRSGEAPKVGIRTYGVRHFLGREVLIEPSVLPWAANYEIILTFLRIATIDNGYAIPDGDTFGPEDHSVSYRVVHRDGEADDVPLYMLTPLLHREHGFVSDDYVPRDRIFDDRMPPPDLMPDDAEAKMALANEWREKRAMAERIGARFTVRARAPNSSAPPPPAPRIGPRAVFGRKKT